MNLRQCSPPDRILRAWEFTRCLGILCALARAGLFAASLPAVPVNVRFHPAETAAPHGPLHSSPGAALNAAKSYGRLPLHFEPNLGQFDPQVRYASRGAGYTLFLTGAEAVMVLSRGQYGAGDPHNRTLGPAKVERAVVRMRLVGARTEPSWEELERQPGVSNYFIGNDPAKWRTDVPNYGRVAARGVYRGIDLVCYGNQRQLEYDLEVAPGADPRQVELAWAGADALRVNDEGDLVLATRLGDLVQKRPRVYQELGGQKVEVATRYVVEGGNRVRFELARYDRHRRLVIDPLVLVYSTALGGSGVDSGYGIAVDASGAAYVTGETSSTNFPTQFPYEGTHQGGDWEVFVTKLSATGDALAYSTYLGGSGEDFGAGIAVDDTGAAYVTGATGSADFPTLLPYQAALKGTHNAFVVKLAPAGNALVYSTYLGGSGDDVAARVAVDVTHAAYVVGHTTSTDFPTQSAFQATNGGNAKAPGSSAAFVTKLGPSGSTLTYSTYLRGSGDEHGLGIAVDAAGSAYVTGYTTSADFPTQTPYQGTFRGIIDAFVTKLASAGNSLVYSTYLGGGNQTGGNAIAVDDSGSAYVTGFTTSSDFPTKSAFQPAINGSQDAFVTKLTSAGDALAYSTYLGGSRLEGGGSIAVDGASAYVSGVTTSPDFPITSSAYQATFQGIADVFVSVITPTGDALIHSTYLGGIGSQTAGGLAVDAAGSAYVTGATSSPDFPTSFSFGSQGYGGVFVAKFTPPPPSPSLITLANGATNVSLTPSLTWSASSGATSYDVYVGTTSPPPLATNTTATSYAPGTLSTSTMYYWQIVARNLAGTGASQTWSFMTVPPPPATPALTTPANSATGVSATPVLTWNAASGATSYKVYFGTAVAPPLVTSTLGTSYSPGSLTAGTLYYWKVLAVNPGGSAASTTWSFTTQVAPPPAPTLAAPANGGTDVLLTPNLSWSASSGATSYVVYFGTTSPPPLVANQAGPSFAPGTLASGITYYWAVAASNAGGSTSSATWSFTTLVAAPVLLAPANGAFGVSLAPVLTWTAAVGATSYDVYFGTQAWPPLVGNTSATSYAAGTLSADSLYFWRVVARDSGGSNSSALRSFATPASQQTSTALQFIPVTPCRIADTRNDVGAFGGPALAANAERSFAIPQAACGIPATAQAYSLNVTAVPEGPLQYLTLWPAGQPRPLVSTLNSFAGDVVANAAIVPAGANGAVSVYVTDPAGVVLDIDGYFDSSAGTGSFDFYASTPCRVVDTRASVSTFGGPAMTAGQSRDFPIPVNPCDIPATATAYSLNATVVPGEYLGYLTAWPTGAAQPNVSTLNSWTGKVVANAAIVPVGNNESISVFVSNLTDLILDINGYFGQPGGAGALKFYSVTPCRVADTRSDAGSFGGPKMGPRDTRSFAIPASACNIPSTAAAYSVNVTVVPDGILSYLSAWPTGSSRPLVSTLNSFDGAVVANAAIVPAGTNGAIDIYVTNPTHVILDINGYFAP